ncbi:MAG TPA: hypothetical protein PLV19_00445 [Nitrosomonas sp.]|nr:hypothetical protein [Nitrosomonas sp.]HQX12629.1 hypothetical protein [Nitrosomonas sp.]HRB32237.1 hypothetical protein [Nitrosomonas sp.]HRB44899.1 hypothetical protein [Nitrosomonas sp.]HRB77170.1 hypothetical protein [Nitrosomonas sp.]
MFFITFVKNKMTVALSLATQLADEIDKFPLGRCGPSDDPDKQYAYVAGFRDIAKRFVGAVKRIGDPDLSILMASLDTSPESITEAYDLRAELYVVIDVLNEVAQNPNYAANVASNAAFLNTEVLIQLKAIQGARLDLKKLVKMCEELNDVYARGNFISSALLLRAIMNHVPPVFGVTTFSDVVANAGRSVKAILTRLNDEARPIADLHTHIIMRATEQLPTKNQLEPYKAGFEVLIQEVLVRLSSDAT